MTREEVCSAVMLTNTFASYDSFNGNSDLCGSLINKLCPGDPPFPPPPPYQPPPNPTNEGSSGGGSMYFNSHCTYNKTPNHCQPLGYLPNFQHGFRKPEYPAKHSGRLWGIRVFWQIYSTVEAFPSHHAFSLLPCITLTAYLLEI